MGRDDDGVAMTLSSGKAIVPARVRSKESELYGLFLKLSLEGVFLGATVKGDCSFSLAAFHLWRDKYTAWMSAIEKRATEDAIVIRRDRQTRLDAKRLETEAVVQEIMLERSRSIVQRVTAIADGREDASLRIQLDASKMVQEWTSEGYAYQAKGRPAPEPEPSTQLTYDPHVGLAGLTLSVPEGTKVTLETPTPVIDLCPETS